MELSTSKTADRGSLKICMLGAGAEFVDTKAAMYMMVSPPTGFILQPLLEEGFQDIQEG